MSNVAQFPNNDAVFIGYETDEETGKQMYLLDSFLGGERKRVGEYENMLELVRAIDAVTGVERPQGTV